MGWFSTSNSPVPLDMLNLTPIQQAGSEEISKHKIKIHFGARSDKRVCILRQRCNGEAPSLESKGSHGKVPVVLASLCKEKMKQQPQYFEYKRPNTCA